jgi:hypothetical protein
MSITSRQRLSWWSEVVQALAALGEPLSRLIATERGLRSFLNLPASEQKHVLQAIVCKAGAG